MRIWEERDCTSSPQIHWRSVVCRSSCSSHSPDCPDPGRLEASVASDERQVKAEGSCGDDSVRHVRNNISRNVSKSTRYVGIERNNCECGIVLSKFVSKSIES